MEIVRIRFKGTRMYYEGSNYILPVFTEDENIAAQYKSGGAITAALNFLDKISKQTNDPGNRWNLQQFALENLEVVTYTLTPTLVQTPEQWKLLTKAKGK